MSLILREFASILIHSRSHGHFYFSRAFRVYLSPASITREIPLGEVRGIERVLNNSDGSERERPLEFPVKIY